MGLYDPSSDFLSSVNANTPQFNLTPPPGTNYAPFLTMLGGGMSAVGTINAASRNASLMRANAAIAGMQAQSAEQQGAQHAELYRQQLDQRMGKQAAFIGGSNVTTSGSALRALSGTAEVGAQDIARIQLGAAQKAWGYRVNQQGDEARASAESSAGWMSGLGGLITTGAKAFGQWTDD